MVVLRQILIKICRHQVIIFTIEVWEKRDNVDIKAITDRLFGITKLENERE